MTHPLRLYDDGLRRVCEPGMRAQARLEDGTVVPLALARYVGPADETDERILRTVRGPELDVGCGPGRHLHALARRGMFALGVDLSPVAVELGRGGGGHAIVASIFDELPGAGTWQSALLLDGNIGIGGAPARLLERVRALPAGSGELLAELQPHEPGRLRHARRWRHLMARARGSPGHWSRRWTSTRSPPGAASTRLHHGGRWFARLLKRRLRPAQASAPGRPSARASCAAPIERDVPIEA